MHLFSNINIRIWRSCKWCFLITGIAFVVIASVTCIGRRLKLLIVPGSNAALYKAFYVLLPGAARGTIHVIVKGLLSRTCRKRWVVLQMRENVEVLYFKKYKFTVHLQYGNIVAVLQGVGWPASVHGWNYNLTNTAWGSVFMGQALKK